MRLTFAVAFVVVTSTACASAPACPCASTSTSTPTPTPTATSTPTSTSTSTSTSASTSRELARRRVDLLAKRTVVLKAQLDKGGTTLAEYLGSFRAVAFAARDSGLTGAELRAPLEAYRDAAKNAVDLAQARAKQGTMGEVGVLQAEADLAEAEYWLATASP